MELIAATLTDKFACLSNGDAGPQEGGMLEIPRTFVSFRMGGPQFQIKCRLHV